MTTEEMVQFVYALAKPNAIVPIPDGVTARDLTFAVEQAQGARRWLYRQRYVLQAEGVYQPS